MDIRIDTCKDGQHKTWTLSEEELSAQGLLETDMNDLNDYLRESDIGIDSGGPFVDQVFEAVCGALETRQRKNLVLADSEDTDMDIWVIPEESDREEEARKRIDNMERAEIVRQMEGQAGIQCYDHETVDELREALFVNVMDGTIELEDL